MTRYLPAVVRISFGALFAFSGLVGLFNLIPMPPPPEKLVPFMTGLMSTGYFFPLLKGTEAICGLLLLTNRFVPLSLVVLSPVIVQIAAFHFLFDHSGFVMSALLLGGQAYLGWAYRSYFRGVLSAKAAPVTRAAIESSGRVIATAS